MTKLDSIYWAWLLWSDIFLNDCNDKADFPIANRWRDKCPFCEYAKIGCGECPGYGKWPLDNDCGAVELCQMVRLTIYDKWSLYKSRRSAYKMMKFMENLYYEASAKQVFYHKLSE